MKMFGARGEPSKRVREIIRVDTAGLRHSAAARARLTIAQLGDAGKTRLLADAIVKAAIARGAVSLHDLRQAGVGVKDAERLYDEAFAAARAFYPAIDAIGTMP